MQPVLERAAHYIESNQVLEDVPERRSAYRHRSRGGWPFSTRAHGWPISDCTAEGLKACAAAREGRGLNQVPRGRLREAVEEHPLAAERGRRLGDVRAAARPEVAGGAEPFGRASPTSWSTYSYVECTSACVQALAALERLRSRGRGLAA